MALARAASLTRVHSALLPSPAAPTRLACCPDAMLDVKIAMPQAQAAPVPPALVSPPPAAPVGRLWSSESGAIAIGGHRGMGENLLLGNSSSHTAAAAGFSSISASATQQPQQHQPPPATVGFRENTLASFQQAAASGASFVEFDVQVTRDGVPVIWHDDLILVGDEAGTAHTARAVADLTLAEFKNLLQAQQGSDGGDGSNSSDGGSIDAGNGSGQLMRNFKGADGNRVGVHPWRQPQEGELPTLAEVFAGLPTSVGFNIEVKMTTPDTVERTPPAEVERVVGRLLHVVEQCTQDGARTVVLSSFDPEVCIALRERLPPRFPVMFLSGGGKYEHVDARRTSVAAAAEFAASAGLQGVVLETSSLRAHEAEIGAVRARGLQLYTYGQANSDAEWLRRQYFLGVQGAIVDDVPGVVAALTASAVSM